MSRELDRLLAKHVFEWTSFTDKDVEYWNTLSGPFVVHRVSTENLRLSTTWEGAGKVVEAMRERGWTSCTHVLLR